MRIGKKHTSLSICHIQEASKEVMTEVMTEVTTELKTLGTELRAGGKSHNQECHTVQDGMYCGEMEHTLAMANAYQLFWLLYCGKKLYVTNTAPAMKRRTPQVVQTRTSITPCECHSEKCWSKQGGRLLKIRTVPKTAACPSLAVEDVSHVHVTACGLA